MMLVYNECCFGRHSLGGIFMPDIPIPPDIRNLSVADRVELATKIWESVADDAKTVGLSEEHKRILDERIREADENPEAMIPAEDVFRDLMGER